MFNAFMFPYVSINRFLVEQDFDHTNTMIITSLYCACKKKLIVGTKKKTKHTAIVLHWTNIEAYILQGSESRRQHTSAKIGEINTAQSLTPMLIRDVHVFFTVPVIFTVLLRKSRNDISVIVEVKQTVISSYTISKGEE
uniref:Uncharacterized protein n=1 Tax=Glossina pallidipes TaxID=7398 RepID=A0A1B0A0X1_GLOPL